MPYSPRLSCEQVEANLAWVAESATVGPALWAEARPTGLLGEEQEVPLPRYRTRSRHRVGRLVHVRGDYARVFGLMSTSCPGAAHSTSPR